MKEKFEVPKERGLVPVELKPELKEKNEKLQKQLATSLRHLEIAKGAMRSDWMEERVREGSFFGDQLEIELESARSRAMAGHLTDPEIVGLRIRAEEAMRNGQDGLKVHEFVRGCEELFVSQNKFDQALELAEKATLTPSALHEIRQSVAEAAIKRGFFDVAERALKDVSYYVPAKTYIAIAEAQREKGSLDEEWLRRAIKSASIETTLKGLQSYLSLATLLHKSGRGGKAKDMVRKAKEFRAENIGDWTRFSFRAEIEEQPFDFVDTRSLDERYYSFPVIREKISRGNYALNYLLEEGLIRPAERLIADKNDLRDQCLLAFYKAKGGLSPLANLKQAHALVESARRGSHVYAEYDRGLATLVSLESRLGLIGRAEKTFAAMYPEGSPEGYDVVARVIAHCELASGYLAQKEGGKEKANSHLEKAMRLFEKATKLTGNETTRLALKLSQALHEQNLDATAVLSREIQRSDPSAYGLKIIEVAQRIGADVNFLLENAEQTMRKSKDFSYSSLIALMELSEQAGRPIERFLNEIDDLYDKADIKHKRYILDSLLLHELNIPQERRLHYWKKLFAIETMTEDYKGYYAGSGFSRYIDMALERGDYRAVWEALFLPDSGLPEELSSDKELMSHREQFMNSRAVKAMQSDSALIDKIFDAAGKVRDFDFINVGREIASAQGGFLAGKMAACDALRRNDFSLLVNWLKENAEFREEDLQSKKQKKRRGAEEEDELEKFGGFFGSAVDDTEQMGRIKEAAHTRIGAARVILAGLKPELDKLDENKRSRLFKDARADALKERGTLQLANEFELLGVEPGATWLEVQRAFAKTVRRIHPDSGEDYDPEYEQRMREKGIFVEDIIAAHNKIRDIYAKEGLIK